MTGEATLDLAPVEGPHGIRFDLQRDGPASQPNREETGQQKTEEKATDKAKTRDQ